MDDTTSTMILMQFLESCMTSRYPGLAGLRPMPDPILDPSAHSAYVKHRNESKRLYAEHIGKQHLMTCPTVPTLQEALSPIHKSIPLRPLSALTPRQAEEYDRQKALFLVYKTRLFRLELEKYDDNIVGSKEAIIGFGDEVLTSLYGPQWIDMLTNGDAATLTPRLIYDENEAFSAHGAGAEDLYGHYDDGLGDNYFYGEDDDYYGEDYDSDYDYSQQLALDLMCDQLWAEERGLEKTYSKKNKQRRKGQKVKKGKAASVQPKSETIKVEIINEKGGRLGPGASASTKDVGASATVEASTIRVVSPPQWSASNDKGTLVKPHIPATPKSPSVSIEKQTKQVNYASPLGPHAVLPASSVANVGLGLAHSPVSVSKRIPLLHSGSSEVQKSFESRTGSKEAVDEAEKARAGHSKGNQEKQDQKQDETYQLAKGKARVSNGTKPERFQRTSLAKRKNIDAASSRDSKPALTLSSKPVKGKPNSTLPQSVSDKSSGTTKRATNSGEKKSSSANPVAAAAGDKTKGIKYQMVVFKKRYKPSKRPWRDCWHSRGV